MKRYETLSSQEIMDTINNPFNKCSCLECKAFIDCQKYKKKIERGNEHCFETIRKYLNEELPEESHWHYLKNDDYPTPGSEVIIAYCYDLGDTERYITTVATYEAVFGYPIWIVGNEKWTFDVKAWMSLPEYEEIK